MRRHPCLIALQLPCSAECMHSRICSFGLTDAVRCAARPLPPACRAHCELHRAAALQAPRLWQPSYCLRGLPQPPAPTSTPLPCPTGPPARRVNFVLLPRKHSPPPSRARAPLVRDEARGGRDGRDREPREGRNGRLERDPRSRDRDPRDRDPRDRGHEYDRWGGLLGSAHGLRLGCGARRWC